MIDHAFKPHEVWTTRDQCEQRLDDPNDENIYGICGARRSEHMDETQGLRVHLATALRERDAAAALANQNAFLGARHKDRADSAEEALTAANARADAAEAAFEHAERGRAEARVADLVAAQEALAAARRECEGLKEALRDVLAHAEWMDSHHGRFPNSAILNARAALSAPAAAAGEEEA